MRNSTTHRELALIAVIGVAVIIAVGGAVGSSVPYTLDPTQFVFTAACIWGFVCWQTWKRVELNRADLDSPLFPSLGGANSLTLLRGGFIALTGGFLFQPSLTGILAWVPGLIYGFAALLDRVDGFVARRSGRSSLLGAELDTLFDALGLLVAPLLAIQLHKLHPGFIAVSLAYYVFIFGIYWRQTRHRPVYPLLPSKLRRAFAGFQMGFVAVIMLPVFPAIATTLLGFAFMLPILLGFVVDWLVVSGRIDGRHQGTAQLFAQVEATGKFVLQPALRIITAVLILFLIDADPLLAATTTTVLIVLALLILLGAGARIAALCVLVLCCYSMNDHTGWYQQFILFASSWLLLLGPGHYVIWRGDDIWVNRQDGMQ